MTTIPQVLSAVANVHATILARARSWARFSAYFHSDEHGRLPGFYADESDDGDCAPAEFSMERVWIVNPMVSLDGRYAVDPIEYYGAAFLSSRMAREFAPDIDAIVDTAEEAFWHAVAVAGATTDRDAWRAMDLAMHASTGDGDYTALRDAMHAAVVEWYGLNYADDGAP